MLIYVQKKVYFTCGYFINMLAIYQIILFKYDIKYSFIQFHGFDKSSLEGNMYPLSYQEPLDKIRNLSFD